MGAAGVPAATLITCSLASTDESGPRARASQPHGSPPLTAGAEDPERPNWVQVSYALFRSFC